MATATKRERTAVAVAERAAKRAAVPQGVRRLNPATGREWQRDDTKTGRDGALKYFYAYTNVVNTDGTAQEQWHSVTAAEFSRQVNTRQNGAARTLGGIASKLLNAAKARATAKGAREEELARYITQAQLLAILARGKTQCFSVFETPDPRERDFVLAAHGTKDISPWAPSLDRTDSAIIHYFPTHVRVVPWGFNNALGPWSMVESRPVMASLVAAMKHRLSGGTHAESAALLAANHAASLLLIAKRRALAPFRAGCIDTGEHRNPSGVAAGLLRYANTRTTKRNAAIVKANAARVEAGQPPLQLHAFTITRDWLLPLLEAELCQETWLPLEFPAHDMHNCAPSLDRTDSSKGYTPDNVKVVLLQVNHARGQWCDEAVLPVLELLLASIVHHTTLD